MYFASWTDFIAMGGHGPFVWAAYGLMAASLVALILTSRLNQHRWLAEQRRRRQKIAQHQRSIIEHHQTLNKSTPTLPEEH